MSHFFSSGCCLGINSLGNHGVRDASRLTTCPLRRAGGAPRPGKRKGPALRTRLARIALALAVLYVMFVGERWVLEHSATAPNELAVATRIADVVIGEALPSDLNATTPAASEESAR